MSRSSPWCFERSRRRFLQTVLAAAGAAQLLANCQQSGAPKPDDAIAPANDAFDWRCCEGQTLHLLLNRHPWTAGLQPYLANFEAQTGIQTNLTIVPEPDYFQVMETALQDETIAIDVFFLPMDSTAYRLWQGSLLQPLTPLLNDVRLTEPSYNLFDFPEGFRLAAMYPPEAESQQLFGIPITFESYILFYNQQLVNQYLDGRVPQTMPDLISAAQTINQRGQGEVFGAVMRGVRSDTIIDTVTGLVLNSWGSPATPLPYNVWFDRDWQRPRFTDPKIVAGLTAYAQLMQAGPPNIQAIDWPEATQLFQNGQAAFYIDASLFGPGYEQPDSAIAGNVGYTRLPRVQSASLTGHWLWGLGIAQQSSQPEAAWLFVQWATSPQMEPLISVNTGGAPRFSSWINASPYTAAMNIEYALCVQKAMQTSRPTAVLHPRWNEIALAIADTIQAIYQGTDGSAAAAQLQARVEQLIAQEA
ncbi:extracellular solute-binding protein [Leptolyngbya iicbica]|uniref:Extracellular solute-binding protein n=2 Tax=Cyanophyceae TaxID=3028117 RepID=A0A4Q7E172_9CYAN|nr:extracellular solute-binding protein [Leptolyngbya sp. LK]RZM75698.1 extracellular solute-binding protein [Leptolyngbya sp. LK]